MILLIMIRTTWITSQAFKIRTKIKRKRIARVCSQSSLYLKKKIESNASFRLIVKLLFWTHISKLSLTFFFFPFSTLLFWRPFFSFETIQHIFIWNPNYYFLSSPSIAPIVCDSHFLSSPSETPTNSSHQQRLAVAR